MVGIPESMDPEVVAAAIASRHALDEDSSGSSGVVPVVFAGGERWRSYTGEALVEVRGYLEGWVSWFVGEFHLTHNTVPKCWARHRLMVAELYAGACFEFYAFDEDADGSLPLMWQREAQALIERLRAVTSGIRCIQERRHVPVAVTVIPAQEWDEEFRGEG